jgi:hypothetical protein
MAYKSYFVTRIAVHGIFMQNSVAGESLRHLSCATIC